MGKKARLAVAFDHAAILADAVPPQRRRALTSVDPRQFLPETFVLAELHGVHRALDPGYRHQPTNSGTPADAAGVHRGDRRAGGAVRAAPGPDGPLRRQGTGILRGVVPRDVSGRGVREQLLLEIAHCPQVALIRHNPNLPHPCHDLVSSQQPMKPFQLPEPWSGDIERAPILFLSSNPSIAACACTDGFRCSGEEFPTEETPDDRVIDFFSRRFELPWAKVTRSGSFKTRRHDGTYATGGGKYWGWARNRADELLGRPARIGTDLALTEVVHCKSTGVGAGVTAACVEKCTGLYLDRVLGLAAAPVLIAVGKQAHETIKVRYPGAVPRDGRRIVGPVRVGGRDRCCVFLPAPGAAQPHKTLTAEEVSDVRAIWATIDGKTAP